MTLESDEVRRVMAELGVVPLKVDMTRPNPVGTKWLRKYGRAAVPFYLVISAEPDADPIPLPEVIRPGLVVEALRKAAD